MTYNPNVPADPNGLPQADEPTLLANFFSLNSIFNQDHVNFAGTFTGISNANPGVVTSPLHTLVTGNTITFQGLSDNTQLQNFTGMGALNGVTVTVTVIDANSFSIGIDTSNTTTYVPYAPSASAIQNFATGYFNSPPLAGYHRQVSLPTPIASQLTPNTNNSIIYPRRDINVDGGAFLRMAFNNTPNTASEVMLNSLLAGSTYLSTVNGVGVKTPWGLILNFGSPPTPPTISTTNFTFPIGYTSSSTIQCLVGSPAPFGGGSSFALFRLNVVDKNTFSSTAGYFFGGPPVAFSYLAVGT